MKNISKLFILAAFLVPVAIGSSAGAIESVKVLASTENYDVFIGDVVNVETRRLEYNGEHKDVSGLIINPNGDSFQGRSFTISEAGLYKVIYQAYFGHHKEEQVINYLCKRRSFDFFNITNPVDISYGEYRYNTASYHHEGVLIDIKNGTEIKFNEALSVDDFLIDQAQADPVNRGYKDRNSDITARPLIDFLVDPTTYLNTDFTSMTIRLTDSVDSSNYVDIKIDDGYYAGDSRSGTASRVRVGASCNWQLGWESDYVEGKINQGKYHNGRSGTGLNMSFRGQPHSDQILSAQILYCSTNARFYTYRGSLETEFSYFINELTDPIVYGNSVWEGFKSGKFFLSIIPTSFSNATGRLLLKSVGKYVLNSEILADTEAPTIDVDTQGYESTNLPRAVLGQRYPLFKAKVFDNYDSNLSYDVAVTYRDTDKQKDIDVSISNGSFLVNKEGIYTIKYDAKDRSGNVSQTVSFKVITTNSYTPIELSFKPHILDDEDEVEAYSVATLPSCDDVKTDHGIGNIVVTRRVLDPNNNEVTIEGNDLQPRLVGEYHVVYTGTDFIGNTGTLNYTVRSTELVKPKFITEPTLPPALIKGFKYHFNNIKAIDTVNNEVVEVTPEILVNDVPYTGEYIADGLTTKITYKAKDATEDFDLDVVNVANSEGGFDHSKYFKSDTFSVVESTYLDTPNVTLTASGKADCTFIKELNPDNFYLGMSKIGDQSKMNIIRIKLIDSTDKNVTITFEINLSDSSHITIQAPALPVLPFTLNGEKIGFEYNDQNKMFLDTNQNSLGTIIKDDNGNPFTGFKHGMYLNIEIDELTAPTTLAIEKICNQTIGYRNKGKDRVEPTIRYNSAFISEQQKGNQFVYPTFEAFDVLSDISSSTISITRPGSTPISGKNDMTTTFTIESVGEYRITYLAKDSSNNTKKVIEIVSVYDDTKPTITVNNPPKDSYKVNDSLAVPSYTAYDESGIYTVDVILIMPTNEMRILTHHVHNEDEGIDNVEYALDPEKGIYDTSFIVDKTTCKLVMSGTYRLRFVVYDDAYNTTTVEYSFTVK